jgi:ribose 5-phosphate isomerase B
MPPRIAISCDHGGFELKDTLVRFLASKSTQLLDLGVHSNDPVDYPEKAHAVAEAVLSQQADLGIVVCSTGIGVSIAANKHRGIRAALCTDPLMARMSREHNDANVLCLGGHIIGPWLAMEIVDAFLNGCFEGGRHARRIAKIEIQ